MRYSFLATALFAAAHALPAIPTSGVLSHEEGGHNSLTKQTQENRLPQLEPSGRQDCLLNDESCLGTELYCVNYLNTGYDSEDACREARGLSPNQETAGSAGGRGPNDHKATQGANEKGTVAATPVVAAQGLTRSISRPGATATTLSVPQATSPRWKEPDSSKCRDNKSGSEGCLGTQRYCELGASTVKDEAKREKAQKDCEASRGGRPSAVKSTGGLGGVGQEYSRPSDDERKRIFLNEQDALLNAKWNVANSLPLKTRTEFLNEIRVGLRKDDQGIIHPVLVDSWGTELDNNRLRDIADIFLRRNNASKQNDP
ncbi:hypothetical protein BDV33DRAFT_185937 [Aspergillus novoparasiticus]|uniref:Uncharacterized protein n=1 Tax=Aspergillus novoparasiticus TaxID=986946 RepID=A0A5N6E7V6_9EURO|nr:hypothetical protein BDV33DRAFT_185937 [Aspergillus novoparasiticus]